MLCLLLFSYLASLVSAATVVVNWDVTWAVAAPDGNPRPVIGVNGKWPCPTLEINKGDRLLLTLNNQLRNESTSIHFHGLFLNGSQFMDGASVVTQCPIPPGSSFTYDFTVDQVGTYWWHSHTFGQYPDGFRGPLIVRDPAPPYGKVDGEFTLTLSDWYDQQMPPLIQAYQSRANAEVNQGHEPIPTGGGLINDKKNASFAVEPNKTYLFRLINVGNFLAQGLDFAGHDLTMVELDGVYTQPTPLAGKNVRLATGQRIGLLLKTKPNAASNFEIKAMFDTTMFPPTPGIQMNTSAYLVYDQSKPFPPPGTLYNITYVDETALQPLDNQPALEPVDNRVVLDTTFTTVDGIHRATVNNLTYLPAKVPTLYTAVQAGGDYSLNPNIYGQVNPFVLRPNEVVEVVINNMHPSLHPWHLHGHAFQVIERAPPNAGIFTGFRNASAIPIKRDTLMVQPNSYAVVRFRADNPGVWIMHCHIEWHVESGLVVTLIEAPEKLQGLPIPANHIDNCVRYPMPWQGNAAGNTRNLLDLAGVDTRASEDKHNGALYDPVTAYTNGPLTPTQQCPPSFAGCIGHTSLIVQSVPTHKRRWLETLKWLVR
ncbi:conidial pigment biosynthesis oxidase Abr1/brown 1 [Trichodelitschia bisporula]|uniref:Conidial pigment biosynthesis oxidase Abr1/brown 1 n=1 Tax=Trichodelitschia bisporula TaxID=703511 RepID=A0A6G1I690_9PEZI|nr:conidial pigment biosynthesis oxidase Abr1/brown 1 [Trichodelitschia bisporula]